MNNNVNSILFIDKWTNKMVEPDVKAVFMSLCQLHTKQLGITIISCIVYIQCDTIRGN